MNNKKKNKHKMNGDMISVLDTKTLALEP